jgi:hypothetical protein
MKNIPKRAPAPPKGAGLVQIKIPDDLRARLDRAIAESGRSISEEIRRSLDRALPP